MITNAELIARNTPIQPAAETNDERGSSTYAVNAYDLMAFGRSPRRWVTTERDTAPPKIRPSDLLRARWLAPAWVAAHLARRPADFNYTFFACPKCGSTGTGRVCRTCGLARVMKSEMRPWSGAAKYCQSWTTDMVSRNRIIVPPSEWDPVDGMVKSLNRDGNATELSGQSLALNQYSGVWHDDATGLEIPVYGSVDLQPNDGGSLDLALGSLHIASDVSPYAWAGSAYNRGLHVVAALAQMLHAAATGEPRTVHLWLLVEGKAPYLVARRRVDAELLQKGRDTVAALLGTYAQCVKTGKWPAFEAENVGTINAWTPVYLEPWMTQGDGLSGNYFALTGVRAEVQAA
jgi:hypothetical protein